MSVLSELLTRRSLNVAASAVSGIPPMPKLTRERLWVRGVDLARIPRESEDKTEMANTDSKKPALHGAAAASHNKAETAKDQANPAKAKPADMGRKSGDASHKTDSGKKSR